MQQARLLHAIFLDECTIDAQVICREYEQILNNEHVICSVDWKESRMNGQDFTSAMPEAFREVEFSLFRSQA